MDRIRQYRLSRSCFCFLLLRQYWKLTLLAGVLSCRFRPMLAIPHIAFCHRLLLLLSLRQVGFFRTLEGTGPLILRGWFQYYSWTNMVLGLLLALAIKETPVFYC